MLVYKQLKSYQEAMKKQICEGSVSEEIPVMFQTLVSSMTGTLDRLTAASDTVPLAVAEVAAEEDHDRALSDAQKRRLEPQSPSDGLASAAVSTSPSCPPSSDPTALVCAPSKARSPPSAITPSTNPYCAMRAGLETVTACALSMIRCDGYESGDTFPFLSVSLHLILTAHCPSI